MLNTQIKYKTSKDYEKLYNLLKDGEILIGFMAISIDRVPDMELSKVTLFFTVKVFFILAILLPQSLFVIKRNL